MLPGISSCILCVVEWKAGEDAGHVCVMFGRVSRACFLLDVKKRKEKKHVKLRKNEIFSLHINSEYENSFGLETILVHMNVKFKIKMLNTQSTF